ncbi:hypothetical protein EGI22_16175 [Lacihabitans sp. LS3-19]|uniref:hypothetical protein n=1 Tax=Lacihabitans sp. LS3-19 TaxID=2487335 RepID=UPI0020CF9F74|nr:hypothetical protein [Lacihabitans sp. LS3-19]MCP9769441.1 hypothetical protein [Lacihabitans sp. LS3-19]
MKITLESPGEWVVAENGHMTYYLDGKVTFEIEPANLFPKERYYCMAIMPDMNKEYFLIKWLEAFEKAKIKEVTIKISN